MRESTGPTTGWGFGLYGTPAHLHDRSLNQLLVRSHP